MRALLGSLAILALAPADPLAQGTDAGEGPRLPEITVEVLEDAWRVGDEKTYTLTFDRAPFGRQAMRLLGARQRPDGVREIVFQQRITLDLRALGQPGTLEQSGTIVYLEDGPGRYTYDEVILRDNGYDTYRSPRDYRDSLQVELDPEAGSYRSGRELARAPDRPLPDPPDAILVDLLAVGHWERVFAMRRRWSLDSTTPLPLLVPTAAPRFDFHLPVVRPREVRPAVVPASLTVEAPETLDLFGARIEAFRCRVEPPGITLWVSRNGGILRFTDGRGLTGTLEP